jgi:CheY-like chemotaxis protein
MEPSLLLLVDDDPNIADLVNRVARRAGHQVEYRADVRKAWEYLTGRGGENGLSRSPLPHLVLLDFNLPGISGLELCRWLRATPHLAKLPVALFTMFDRPDDIAAGLDAGMDFLFPKDLLARPDDWRERLEEILRQVHGQALTLSLSSSVSSGLSDAPEQLIAAINRGLLPLLRQLGPVFLRALAPRVCRRTEPLLAEADAGQPPPPMDSNRWLLPSGLGFDPDHFARHWTAAAVVVFATGLAEEITQVLGPAITAPFRATLASLASRPFPSGRTLMTANVPVILLVEDSPADIQIMQRAVRETSLPVELIVVRDGEEAVDYLLRQGKYAPATSGWRNPSLVLLDLNLPRLSGSEVLRRLRASNALQTVPVIVFSTSSDPADIREAYAAGANTYIQKPRDFNRFLEVLRVIECYWLETAWLPPPS